MESGMPQFVSFGEALTDLIRRDGDSWVSVPGGAPWNMARVMACFDVPSAFGGAISRDCFGDALWQSSVQSGLDLRFLQRPAKSPLLAIVYETHPPRYFFVGDDSADLHFDVAALPAGWERAVRWAHFGGISLARQPLAERLVGLAETLHAQGVRISYDPNFRAVMDERYDPILKRMMAIADLVKVSEEDLRPVIDSMMELNRAGAVALRAALAHAATDVTGFGLAGHLHEMLDASGVGAVLNWDALPLFDGVYGLSCDYCRPGKSFDIAAWARPFVARGRLDDTTYDNRMGVLCDPQTSGGLLAAIDPDQTDVFEEAFQKEAGRKPSRIGTVVAGESIIRMR